MNHLFTSSSQSESKSSFLLFLLAELCAMPQKPGGEAQTVDVLA
jgi:hypothetical protein